MGEVVMDVFTAPRLGMVVPPENPTAEPELSRFLGSAMHLYATRFPLWPGMGLREMLEGYNVVLPDVLGTFGQLRLDAAVVSCSASHYLLGPDGDQKFCDELGERAGFPVRSSTLAILAACAALGVTRLNLVSPYEQWLTEQSRRYWEESGLAVERIVRVRAGNRFDPYQVTTREILDQLRRHDLDPEVPLLCTGTGMFTLGALEELAADPDRVLLTSNLASAWWALRVAGAPSRTHPLLRRLEGLSLARSGSRPRAPF
jgi:maleate cis-trans isomerase